MINHRTPISTDFEFHRAEALRLRQEAMRIFFADLFNCIRRAMAYRQPPRSERTLRGFAPHGRLQDRFL